MSLKKINALILLLFVLVVSIVFSYSYSLTKESIINENISRIKGDVLELGYTIMKSVEKDGFASAVNLLHKSVATHKEYASISIAINNNIIVSTNKKLINSIADAGAHIDELNFENIDEKMKFFHEYPVFDKGVEKEIHLIVDLDREYLAFTEREVQSIIYTFLFYGLIIMILFLSSLYMINIRPLVRMNKNIIKSDFVDIDFHIKEYNNLYDSLKNKYKEIALLNKTLEDKVQERTNLLTKTNEQFKEAQSIAQLGSWEWDIVTQTLTWSDEIYRIFGRNKKEYKATYENFVGAIHVDDRKKVEDAIQNSINTGDYYAVKHRIALSDGTEKMVLEQGHVELDQNGKPIRMIGTVLDITARHEREKELRLQSELLNSVTDSILMHDLDGNILYVNRATYTTRGYAKEELLKMKIQELDYHDEKLGSEVYVENLKKIQKDMDEKGEAIFEVSHKTKNGKIIPLEVTSKLIDINEQKRIISIARDITERKALYKNLEISEKKYRNLVENSQVGIFSTKVTGEILYVNEHLVDILGYSSKEELYQQKAIVSYKDPEQRVLFLRELINNSFVENMEINVLTKDGDERFVTVSAHIEDETLSGIILDITESKKAVEEITKLSQAIEQIDDIIMITDRSGVLTFVNDSYVSHTGYTYEESIGKPASIIKSGKHDNNFYKDMWKQIRSGEAFRAVVTNRKKDGELYYEEKTITPITNNDGDILSYVSTGKDISSRIEMQHDLEKLASTDQLTGIYNRHKFEEIFQHEIERSIRYKTKLSLIMFDIDHFKDINDNYGHDIGDIVLQEITNLVNKHIRNIDVFARWGGEEFFILSPETDIDNATVLAEKLRKEIESYKFNVIEKVSASFGVTMFSEEDDKNIFTKRVDKALYKAKEEGRNRVVAC